MLRQYGKARRFFDIYLQESKNSCMCKFLLAHLDNNADSLYDFITSTATPDRDMKDFANPLSNYYQEILPIFKEQQRYWQNTFLFHEINALVLYSIIRHFKPQKLIEISPFKRNSTLLSTNPFRQTQGPLHFQPLIWFSIRISQS